MTYQDDVAERRTMLDAWLHDTTADLTAARRALNQLTVIDGPQHLDVTAGITAALEAVASARRALDHDPHATNTARIQAWQAAALAGDAPMSVKTGRPVQRATI